jgi:hypothetical protein
LIYLFVKHDYENIDAVPKERYSLKLCELIAWQGYSSLEYIPKEFQTEKVCLNSLINNRKDNYKYLPKCYKEYAATKFLISNRQNPKKFIGDTMDDKQRKVLHEYIIKANPANIECIPTEDLTEELCKLSTKMTSCKIDNDVLDVNVLKFFPEKYKTYKLCRRCLRLNPFAFKYIPDNVLTIDLCLDALTKLAHLDTYMTDKCQKLILLITKKIKKMTTNMDGLL